MGIIRKQHQCGQSCGTDRISFCHSLCRIAYRIQRIGHGTYRFRHSGHFRDTTCIVRNRTISIQCHHDTRHGQHGCRRHRNTIQTATELVRHINGDTDRKNRIRRRFHRHAQTGDDIRTVPRRRSLGNIPDRLEIRSRIVFRDIHHQAGQHDTCHRRADHLVTHPLRHNPARHADKPDQ